MKRLVLAILLTVLAVRPMPAAEEPATVTGSAFVVNAGGFLLTCAHVVEDADQITVTLDGKTYEASVLTTDPATDLALLEIQTGGLSAVPLADSNAVRQGEEVRACGYPLASEIGTSVKVTRGTVSGILPIHARKTFQIDAPVNPGNSGGPVLNARGEVIGVVNAKISAPGVEGTGFAVPINYSLIALAWGRVDPTYGKPTAPALAGTQLAARAKHTVALVTVKRGADAVGADAGTVRARCFEVVGADGKVCGRLEANKLGGGGLSLYDTKGKERATLAVVGDVCALLSLNNADKRPCATLMGYSDGGGHLILQDVAGKPRAMLRTLTDGTASLALSDAAGKARGMFQLSPDGSPDLLLLDANGNARGSFGILKDVPTLGLFDAAGKPRGGFALLPSGSVCLALLGADGKARGSFELEADGTPGLVLRDADGKARGDFSLLPNGAPGLVLRDADGKARGMFQVDTGGWPRLGLCDADGKAGGAFGVLPNGAPSLTIRDAGGNIRGMFSVLPNGAADLTLCDAAGRVLWHTP